MVRQMEPGSRLRLPFRWRGPMPPNAESVAERLFECAIYDRGGVLLASFWKPA
jgi:hypothetical protein